MSQAGDAVFLDDRPVFHGVTPIEPLDPRKLAIRDVLVITFTRA
ncbi:MAG: 2OG-Fe dioxygenase family protein [Alphaproteobacteria bacterium]|nr:2OG-Fe dioxygenase family protein [Alphaproteobacteria bacterium]